MNWLKQKFFLYHRGIKLYSFDGCQSFPAAKTLESTNGMWQNRESFSKKKPDFLSVLV
jgi:hypothetical protein